jgi:predicted Zn-dependent protease
MDPSSDLHPIAQRFRRLAPSATEGTIRIVEESSTTTSVRRDVPEPVARSTDLGAMITIAQGDGVGYAATSDLSESGLKAAIDRALQWACTMRGRSVFQGATIRLAFAETFSAPAALSADWSLAERIERLREESSQALQLLAAPNCPSGTFDLLLMPDQMMLQIHESIGHPLELDRILGDERNYAGTSFVTPEMFGTYRYGSELLNITFDPTRAEEFATFAYDDDGSRAQRQHLIRDGLLLQPLGGALSRQRMAQASWSGCVATTRACSWNRPPIDRMSNLNLEAGTSSFERMVSSIDDGILMQTNASWSIDDSRNKFQFGCEWGQRIRSGRLAEVVRNPNYRGISATFWRSLAMVGDAASVEVLGTPFCGKGEPNQVIRVGHASPACKFAGATVFGAEH